MVKKWRGKRVLILRVALQHNVGTKTKKSLRLSDFLWLE